MEHINSSRAVEQCIVVILSVKRKKKREECVAGIREKNKRSSTSSVLRPRLLTTLYDYPKILTKRKSVGTDL